MQYITAPRSYVYFMYTEQALIDYCKCVSDDSPAIFNLKLCVYEPILIVNDELHSICDVILKRYRL